MANPTEENDHGGFENGVGTFAKYNPTSNAGELTFEEGAAIFFVSTKSNPFLRKMLLEGWEDISEYSVLRW